MPGGFPNSISLISDLKNARHAGAGPGATSEFEICQPCQSLHAFRYEHEGQFITDGAG